MPEGRSFWARQLDSDFAAALLLAVAALATAWSSYQASIWSGIEAAEYTYSSVLRDKEAAARNEVDRRRMLDVMLFTQWLEASTYRRDTLARFFELHFRPEFRPSFERWRQNATTANLTATPFDGLDYRQRTEGNIAHYDSASWHALKVARQANGVSDNYVFVTVILASVLFFAGAVRPLVDLRLRKTTVVIAGVLLVWAVIRLVRTPVAGRDRGVTRELAPLSPP